MSFYTSLSGLQASQTDMNTISHNLANVSTTGFKKSRVEFSDVIASSVSTDPRKMVGSGVVVKATTQQFKEGKEQVIGFFVGQIMKISQGKANPGQVNKMLKEKLSK